MHPDNTQHAGDDVLELYSLGRLEDSELDSLEEHLLVCTTCQDRVRETDSYVKAIRAATSKLLKTKDRSGRAGSFCHFWRKPMVAVAGLVLVALGLYWTVRRPLPQAPVAVLLQALRGDQFPVKVPADVPLSLEMDLTGLPSHAAWEVELVDSAGRQIWRATAQPVHDRLVLEFRRGLEPGTYWIRLYAPDSPREAAREFGLESVTGYAIPNFTARPDP